MQKVAILGAGGFGREVLDIFLACNRVSDQYEILGFIDDDRSLKGKELNGYPVLGDFEWFASVDRDSIRVICGIGSPSTRRKVVFKALQRGLQFCNVVHPSAVITPFVSLGTGVVIAAGCIFTNQIGLGDHVHVNLDCTIGHDCVIDDVCTLAPGVHVSGNVRIGVGCEVGTGAVILQDLTIGAWSVMGAGCVVTKDMPDNILAVGAPAKVIRTRLPGWHEK